MEEKSFISQPLLDELIDVFNKHKPNVESAIFTVSQFLTQVGLSIMQAEGNEIDLDDPKALQRLRDTFKDNNSFGAALTLHSRTIPMLYFQYNQNSQNNEENTNETFG